MNKLTTKQYSYIQDALTDKFYAQEKSGVKTLSDKSRISLNQKLQQLLPNNYFEKVLARIKAKEVVNE